jgi:hypothetical protein
MILVSCLGGLSYNEEESHTAAQAEPGASVLLGPSASLPAEVEAGHWGPRLSPGTGDAPLEGHCESGGIQPMRGAAPMVVTARTDPVTCPPFGTRSVT